MMDIINHVGKIIKYKYSVNESFNFKFRFRPPDGSSDI